MQEENQRIAFNVFNSDLGYLDGLHTNRSEALRMLIRFHKSNQVRFGRQILQNMSIGFIALGVFFILASWINLLFLVIAILIFGYETADIVRIIRSKHHVKDGVKTV